MYQQPMSDSIPKVSQKLKLKGVLKSVSDAASIASQIADLVKAWLGPNLESAKADPELVLEICRKVEQTAASVKGRKLDKKQIVLLVVAELHPTITAAELEQISNLVDFLCLYKMVDRKGSLARLAKAVARFFF